MMVVNVMQSVVAKRIEIGAEGGSRTRTTLRSTDFKSVASAIPPPRHARKNTMPLADPTNFRSDPGNGKIQSLAMRRTRSAQGLRAS